MALIRDAHHLKQLPVLIQLNVLKHLNVLKQVFGGKPSRVCQHDVVGKTAVAVADSVVREVAQPHAANSQFRHLQAAGT